MAEPVYQMEENGVTNILQFIRDAKDQGKPIPLGTIKNQAQLFISFIEKLQAGRKLMWHAHLLEESEKILNPIERKAP